MASVSKYFHDRMVLLFLSANAFLTVLITISVLFRLQGDGEGYIVQYRANLGISAFETGSVDQILSFVLFALLVLGIHTALSWKAYGIKRELAVLILGLGTLLLVLCAIVSDALLAIR